MSGPGAPAVDRQDTPARTPRPHVVIVGAGFAGLSAAKALAGRPVELTIIDRENYHLFQPLLYQVATATLSPGDIAQPVRHIVGQRPNVRVIRDTATSIDLDRRVIGLGDGTGVAYDRLIVAAGARHSYFGHPERETFAPGLKTVDDALEVRRRILTAFEDAERTLDADERDARLTFVVVGGGPTGVELAGALAEIARHTLTDEFRSIDTREARVVLCESGPRLLPTFPPELSRKATEALERFGVEVRTGTYVTNVTRAGVTLRDGEIPSRTVLWAAGVEASPLGRDLGVGLDRLGRVPVEPDLTLASHPEVSVIGDLAFVTGAENQPLPGIAPVAVQEGRAAGENVWRAVNGMETRPFRFRDRGAMAVIGRNAAVARIGPLRFGGPLAWVAWLAVHIAQLIGFRNRLLVLTGWAWSYMAWHRGVRLITRGWTGGGWPGIGTPAAPQREPSAGLASAEPPRAYASMSSSDHAPTSA